MYGRKKRIAQTIPKLKILNPALIEIGSLSDKLHLKSYLVGGAIRDRLLNKRNLDIDIVVEGDPSALVKKLSVFFSAKMIAHPVFGTFVLILPTGNNIDFATSRKETYPFAGSLPVVQFGRMKDDLFRRDFTINAMAMMLSGPNRGQVVDYYGGLADLKNNLLRVMHEKSFRDDPTRILRLARFAGRGYKIEVNTEKLALRDKSYLAKVSAERRREEFLAIIREKDPYKSLRLIEKWGIADFIFPGIKIDPEIKRIKNYFSIENRLNFLFKDLPDKGLREMMNGLSLSRQIKKALLTKRASPTKKTIIGGTDLIKMGYKPGPLFKKILKSLSSNKFTSRRAAVQFLFDKFPQKI